MKKIYLISLLLTYAYVLIGCSIIYKSSISGTYRSGCVSLGVPNLEVEFSRDHSFKYGNLLSGIWQIKKDTLFLYAEEFEVETISEEEFWDLLRANPDATDFPPISNGQYTSAKGCDVYLIKGRKLHPLTEDGFATDCRVLKKVNK